MIDSPAHRISNNDPEDDHPLTDNELTELRSLLLGPERIQLLRLQEQLNNLKLSLENLNQTLPKAVILQLIRSKQLTTALTPTIEEAIKVSVKKNRRTLADAIFPMMGPAIRKAISTTLSGMIQSFNQILEHSFSWQGLKWRLEALRTGKSFAEVVLLHTFIYQVEQVFLIHKKTGLLLQHVAAESIKPQDADLVSGMLTAIQDFVHDSFGVQDDTFETLKFGELTVWIEHGPQAILASVIRGNPSQDLRSVFQSTIETIHFEQSDTLESFQGDTAPFEANRPYLEACLQSRYESKGKKTPPFYGYC